MKTLKVVRVILEIGLVAAVLVLYQRPPTQAIPWKQTIVRTVPTDQKLAALTFDDGPNPKFTMELLKELDKLHVKATFFMIGKQMEKYPDIVKAVLDGGHEIGNHTFNHPPDMENLTTAQVIREIQDCDEVIQRMTGRRPVLFRPPKGLIDGTVAGIAEDEGYATILWTVSADHHDAPTPTDMMNRVVRQARPGMVILAHDGTFPIRWKDVVATPLMIKALMKQGYKFVTVSELLNAHK
jgi:peptidoglycan-N-acetylglucosamine deacetylase